MATALLTRSVATAQLLYKLRNPSTNEEASATKNSESAAIAALTEQVKSLRDQMITQEKTIAELKKTNAEQAKDIAELKKTNADQQRTNAEQAKDIAELKKTNADQAKQIAELKQKVADQGQQIQILQEKLSASTMRNFVEAFMKSVLMHALQVPLSKLQKAPAGELLRMIKEREVDYTFFVTKNKDLQLPGYQKLVIMVDQILKLGNKQVHTSLQEQLFAEVSQQTDPAYKAMWDFVAEKNNKWRKWSELAENTN